MVFWGSNVLEVMFISPTFEGTRNGEFTRKPLKNELFVKNNFGCPAASLLMILIKGLFLRIPEVP